MTDNAQTAIVYLQQGRQLIADVAKAVVPDAVVKQTVSDGPPGKCKSPLDGFVFFSISRDFEAPAGHTGSSVLPAIATALKSRGFSTTPTESGGAFDTLHATKDDSVGVAAMGSPTSGLIRIGVDTQCGKASAEDDNVGTAPSASAS